MANYNCRVKEKQRSEAMPLRTEAEQYQEVTRHVHGALPQRRWHALRCCVDHVGSRYSHAVLTQVYLEVLAAEAQLPPPPAPAGWRAD